MGLLRIRLKELGRNSALKKEKKYRPGHCKRCGSKLTDEASLKCGYGPRCFELSFAIVMEIVPDTEAQTTLQSATVDQN